MRRTRATEEIELRRGRKSSQIGISIYEKETASRDDKYKANICNYRSSQLLRRILRNENLPIFSRIYYMRFSLGIQNGRFIRIFASSLASILYFVSFEPATFRISIPMIICSKRISFWYHCQDGISPKEAFYVIFFDVENYEICRISNIYKVDNLLTRISKMIFLCNFSTNLSNRFTF